MSPYINSGDIKFLQGNDPESSENARIVNKIIIELNAKGHKLPDAILYLGRKQKWAIRNIDYRDPCRPKDDNSFCNRKVVWVELDDYIHLAQ
jgi:hypothetical protein